MKEAIFLTYPWDLEDEGVENAIAKLAGEIGVDAIVVPVLSSRVVELRSRRTEGPRICSIEPGAYFQPAGKFYGDSRIKPHAVALLKARNPLEKIDNAAGAQVVAVRVRIDACRGEQLIDRYPMAACVNALGYSSKTRLCPANPDVRAYLAALVEDLSTNYAIKAIELAEAHFGHGLSYETQLKAGVALDPVMQMLLSWCFCPSCREQATEQGIDVEKTKSRIAEHIANALAMRSSATTSPQELFHDWPEFRAYHAVRVESVTSLHRKLRQRARCPLFHVPTTNVFLSASETSPLSEYCAGFVIPPADSEMATWYEHAGRYFQGHVDSGKIIVTLPCTPPRTTDGPSLVSAVHNATQRGFAGVVFSHYGISPEPCLDWVRKSIRYARRESR